MSITLTYGSTVVTLGDKERAPFSRMLVTNQSIFETDASTRVVYDHGNKYTKFDINLENLTTTEKDNLERFWFNTVSMQAKAWDFKDSLDRVYRVFFDSEELDPIMQEGGARWNVTISLRADDRLSQYILYMPLESNLDLVAGTGAATFSRSTIGTYRENGIIKTAAINEARFEENGLLHEGPSINLMLQSEDFSTTWSPLRLNVSINAAIAPDGELTADKIYDDATVANNHVIYQNKAHAIGVITSSLYVKAAEYSNVRLALYNATDGFLADTTFDLITGVATIASGTATIVDASNGWWRISVTGTATVAGSYYYVYLHNGTSGTYDGDGVSGIYVWGAQLEDFRLATSYIKVTTSTAARTTDLLSIQYTDNFPEINNPLTVLVDFETFGVISSGQRVLQINGELLRLLQINPAATELQGYYGPSQHADIPITANTLKTFGLTYDGTTIKSYSDGVFAEAVTAGTPTGAATAITLGAGAAGVAPLYGHIKSLKAYDVALHATELRVE
jgi:hypothetical protein